MAAEPESLLPILLAQMQKLDMDPARGPEPLQVVIAYRERAETLRELAITVSYLYQDDITLDPAAAKKHLRGVMQAPLQSLLSAFAEIDAWTAQAIHAAMAATADKHELKFGKIGQPLRVAVTGGPVSPPIDVTVELVGKARTLERLQEALKFIEKRIAESG
jgi:glutamyl-tRNA synthetase